MDVAASVGNWGKTKLSPWHIPGVFFSLLLVYLVLFGTKQYAKDFDAPSVIDTKLAVHQEGAALLDYKSGTVVPNHLWYRDGLRFRDGKKKVTVCATPGYFGYGAGPESWIIDSMGLCDPLLGRIPGVPHPNHKGGHYLRDVPEGYEETLTGTGNHLADPSLRQYYDVIVSVTQGPLFS